MILAASVLVPYVEDLFLVPPNLNEYEENEFLHWHVFLCIHLGQALSPESLRKNGEIISELTIGQLKSYTVENYMHAGVEIIFFENTLKESLNEADNTLSTGEDRDSNE